jgi:hypothetical protein
LTIDVSAVDDASARAAADSLLLDLITATNWPVVRDY